MTLSTAPQAHSELDVQVAALTTRVHGIEEGQRGIISTLNGLSAKLDARSSTNWPVIGTFCGVSVAFAALVIGAMWNIGGMAMGQVKADQERITAAIVKLDDKFMPASQINHEFEQRGELIKANESADSKGIDVNRAAIVDLQHSVVPRGEHEEHWRSEDQRFADQQRQIDDVKHTLGGLYDARDVIKDLNERTRSLETRPR